MDDVPATARRVMLETSNPLDVTPADLEELAEDLEKVDPNVVVELGYDDQYGAGVTGHEILFFWVPNAEALRDGFYVALVQAAIVGLRKRFRKRHSEQRTKSLTVYDAETGRPLEKWVLKTADSEPELEEPDPMRRGRPQIRPASGTAPEMSAPPQMTLSPWDGPPLEPLPLQYPRDIWAAAKQIDELGGEWSYLCFSFRALNFHLYHVAPLWFEPLRGFDELYQEAYFRALAEGLRVPATYAGEISATFEVFKSVFSAPTNSWLLPEQGESPIGRHTVSIVGIQDDDTLRFQHGWSDWPKDFAIGSISRAYIDRYATELWVSRRYGAGPLNSTFDKLINIQGSPEYASMWRKPGRRGSETITDQPDLRIRWWESFSIQENAPGEVVALTLSDTIRVAVALVLYEPEEATIMDLFVWPGYRRRGFATILERIVAQRATSRGIRKLSVLVLDADVVRGQERATRFLASRGYAIQHYENCQVRMQAERDLA